MDFETYSKHSLKFVNDLYKIKNYNKIKGIILSGGPSTVTKKKFPSIQKEILLKAEDEMSSQFIETQNQEKEFVQTLQEKYGEGTLDIEKGLFIPNS